MDLTPVRQKLGPARLLEMSPGRSEAIFKTWLADRDPTWKNKIEVVTKDGFTGFKTAAAEQLPEAIEVLDTFHVVKLGADSLDKIRQRVQREQKGRRGLKNDPLYKARRTLTAGLRLATEGQKCKVEELLNEPSYQPVHLVWSVYQRMADAYRQPGPEVVKRALSLLIDEISVNVPGWGAGAETTGDDVETTEG